MVANLCGYPVKHDRKLTCMDIKLMLALVFDMMNPPVTRCNKKQINLHRKCSGRFTGGSKARTLKQSTLKCAAYIMIFFEVLDDQYVLNKSI